MTYTRHLRTYLGVLLIPFGFWLATGATAQSDAARLPMPEGSVVLEITGQIQTTNAEGMAVFDIEGLESLGLVDLVTETPWTDGDVTFSGVLARTILDRVGAEGGTIRAVALNDYSVAIPISDVRDHDVIIATRRDGARMRVRDRGPLWVIYPWSDDPGLRTEVYYARSIWQLKAIEVTD